jgi:hypothetical protein
MQRRLAQIDESIARYLSQLDSADRQREAVPEAKITRLNEKIATLRQEIQRLNALNVQILQTDRSPEMTRHIFLDSELFTKNDLMGRVWPQQPQQHVARFLEID